jgi:hypothetical protein
MQSTVEAAIISGCFGLLGIGGTVWVAIAGFRANQRISSESAKAERDKALWEKRCATYEEILGVLDERRAYRKELADKAQATKVEEIDFGAMLPITLRYTTEVNDPDTRRARSRLLAYASPEVHAAYEEMIGAETELGLSIVVWTHGVYKESMKHLDKGEAPPDPESHWPRFDELLGIVMKRDRELIDLIRRELGSGPVLLEPARSGPTVSPPAMLGDDQPTLA